MFPVNLNFYDDNRLNENSLVNILVAIYNFIIIMSNNKVNFSLVTHILTVIKCTFERQTFNKFEIESFPGRPNLENSILHLSCLHRTQRKNNNTYTYIIK